ncbi:MAG: hypothetical protein ACI4KG_04205 [Oscillospiraceae bacterium]
MAKKSFKKIFLPVFIASAAILLIRFALEGIYGLICRLFIPDAALELMSFTDYIALMNSSGSRLYDIIFTVLTAVIISPLYIGFYKFCFARLNDEPAKFGTVFEFYRSPKKILGSAAAKELCAWILGIISFFLDTCITGTLQSVLAENDTAQLYPVLALITGIAALAVSILLNLFFWLTEYVYACESENGIIAAFKNAVEYSKGSRLKIFGITVLQGTISVLYAYFFLKSNGALVQTGVFSFIPDAVIMWIGLTFAHGILFNTHTDEQEEEGSNDEGYDETDGDEPFIKPYDFFIEADERFTDEKIIKTEDIRSLDPVHILEEMALCDDVKNNWGVRRKLKKLFDDLAFEIGEYVSYEGGRSIESFVTEEIDERELEISVGISRNSDSEPFEAVISIKEN